jgi:hypothetical protein
MLRAMNCPDCAKLATYVGSNGHAGIFACFDCGEFGVADSEFGAFERASADASRRAILRARARDQWRLPIMQSYDLDDIDA